MIPFKLIITGVGLICAAVGFCQTYTTTEITALLTPINESSGLLILDDRVITHNDSGDDAFLYEISEVTGAVERTVAVPNATSADWEDICKDDNYIYIGDIGNNAGSRTDLMIFRILIDDYLTTPNDTVFADTIAYSYADQTSFEPAVYSTNYDAEALIAYNDSLYLFTKNWVNFKTNVYAIPKTPGTYSVTIRDSINTEGLVTGADYDAEKNEILLSGYTIFNPFIYLVKNFSGTGFSEAEVLFRGVPSLPGSIQVEGCAALGNHTYYVSSENEDGDLPYLTKITFTSFSSVKTEDPEHLSLYPNPAQDVLVLNPELTNGRFEILSETGEVLMRGKLTSTINIQQLPAGNYFIRISKADGQKTACVQFIKN